jgi:uncharacterized protein YceH (UPF0502 family)
VIEPDDVQIRVLGCLIEKQRTTPSQYPLSLNSLRLACNQATNRDPVVDYDEATVRAALGELGRRGWIRSASGHSSRTAKYRQLLDSELGLADDEISVLTVLMLRGDQTPGQIKQRTERMHPFADLDEVMLTIEGLIERDLVQRLPRRPGQKEERFRQTIGGAADGESTVGEEPPTTSDFEERHPVPGPATSVTESELAEKVARLEAEMKALKAELALVRQRLEEI